jgi:hypothetical protein
MLSWILKQVKILSWVMAVSPLLFVGFSLFDTYYDYPIRKEMFDKGTETVASIEGGTRSKRRRSGTSFSVNLAWKDKSGAPRSAEKVSISTTLADQLIKDDALIVDTLKIKYLEGDAEATPLVLADMASTGPGAPLGLELALYLLPVGLIGGGILYGLRRREQRTTA